MIWLFPHTLLPPLSRQKARTATHSKTEKERQLGDGRGGGGGGGAQSYDSKTALSSLNHSILSDDIPYSPVSVTVYTEKTKNSDMNLSGQPLICLHNKLRRTKAGKHN
jgi:hypothetical protein